jgi:hypothetical protein
VFGRTFQSDDFEVDRFVDLRTDLRADFFADFREDRVVDFRADLRGDLLADLFVVLRDDFFADFPVDFFADFFGTLPPARRASDKPIAMACLRLVTFFPDPPLRSVPSLRSCIAFRTFACAFLPYLAMVASLVRAQPDTLAPLGAYPFEHRTGRTFPLPGGYRLAAVAAHCASRGRSSLPATPRSS